MKLHAIPEPLFIILMLLVLTLAAYSWKKQQWIWSTIGVCISTAVVLYLLFG